MKNSTKKLTEEHKNILKVIGLVEEECSKIEAGKAINKSFFIKSIEFIRNYADKLHHAKEEDILFKEINKNESCMHCNPVQQMLFEHDEGRKFVQCMEEGLNENDKENLVLNARGYCSLLRAHISKEDDILYPMAEEAIPEKSQKKILQEFDKIDKSREKEIKKNIKLISELKNE